MTTGQATLQFVRKPSYLRIRKDRVAVLKLAILDESGEVVEYREDFTYLHGGYRGAPSKVEAFLENKQVGDRGEVVLAPEEGFGAYNPELVVTAPADAFPADARKPGDRVRGEAADGSVVDFRVERVEEDGRVTVNGNHPYAGKTLSFVMEVTNVREARPDELQAGFAFVAKPGE
jgi:FKBP-type peptidyl-prolyl cis-trans isomerase SlyD